MKKQYFYTEFHRKSLVMIGRANDVIEEYAEMGYKLTLRQLYYQFVARGWIENKVSSYNQLANVVSNGRNGGLIDWDAIVDRTRELRALSHWDSPADIVRACSTQFCYDLWENQKNRVEVWVEKDALVGVFEPVCRELDIALFSCRGYASQSEVWAAGRRLRVYALGGQKPVVLHFGDHDPSGMDMTRDIMERLSLYAGRPVLVTRLALNFDQVEEYKPPPNPAKVTDTRYEAYAVRYGEESWELDALEPTVIGDLIRNNVEMYRDESLWNKAVDRQEQARGVLARKAEEIEREEEGDDPE